MQKLREFVEILNNEKLFLKYLVVGIIFSIISIIGPVVSGEVVNAVIYQQKELQRNILFLIGIYGVQVLFSILDQHYSKYFGRNQKRKMRDSIFGVFLNQRELNREKISSFISFVNNDIPDIVENYFQGLIDIIKCCCIIIGSSIVLSKIHWILAIVIIGCSFLIVRLPNILKEQAADCRKKCAVAMEKYNTMLESFLAGVDIIKTYSYQNHAKTRMVKENETVPLMEEYKSIIKYARSNRTKRLEKIEQIEVEQLSYQASAVKILDKLTLSFERDKKYLLMGESGSGKTTLLKLLGGLNEFDYTGEIYVNGISCKDIDRNTFYNKIANIIRVQWNGIVIIESNEWLQQEERDGMDNRHSKCNKLYRGAFVRRN